MAMQDGLVWIREIPSVWNEIDVDSQSQLLHKTEGQTVIALGLFVWLLDNWQDSLTGFMAVVFGSPIPKLKSRR